MSKYSILEPNNPVVLLWLATHHYWQYVTILLVGEGGDT